MHDIEPHYNWKNHYSAEEDERSPFFGRKYSEFEFTNTIYNYFIHPQWDDIRSNTLYMKELFADYDNGYAVLEFIGEWNDAINNDIMFLKRDIIDTMIGNGINKFILIGENVLNFHASDDEYYNEWFDDVEDGWIAALNFRGHVLNEMEQNNIDSFFVTGGELNNLIWRTFNPMQLFLQVESIVRHRIA